MAAKKFNEIKKELPLEEGKLVSDFSSVLDKIMADLKSKLGREYQKNSEKGIAMINTIGAMVGAKVTDKKQSKNRLFLKFDNDLELRFRKKPFSNLYLYSNIPKWVVIESKN